VKAEILKMATSLVLLFAEVGFSLTSLLRELKLELVVRWREFLLTAVPALLFTL
jgi:hypothetical protein